MSQAQFVGAQQAASTAEGLRGCALAASLFADRAHLRAALRDDIEAAGLDVAHAADLSALRDDVGQAGPPLGDVALIDCPQVGGAELAALARIDQRAAQCGAQLVVSTSLAALDGVFGCLAQADAQILVDPSQADRIVALGRALARISGHRMRELDEIDRLTLLRLSEQVERIAQKLDRLAGAPATMARIDGISHDRALDWDGDRFEAPRHAFAAARDDDPARLLPKGAAAFPDARLVRRIIRQRQLRARFFDADLFADPAWDILLDLTAARAENLRVSVSSLCVAAGVPPTTALRWIGQMTDAGLLRRDNDHDDRRRAFITLTDRAAEAVAGYFAALGPSALRLV